MNNTHIEEYEKELAISLLLDIYKNNIGKNKDFIEKVSNVFKEYNDNIDIKLYEKYSLPPFLFIETDPDQERIYKELLYGTIKNVCKKLNLNLISMHQTKENYLPKENDFLIFHKDMYLSNNPLEFDNFLDKISSASSLSAGSTMVLDSIDKLRSAEQYMLAEVLRFKKHNGKNMSNVTLNLDTRYIDIVSESLKASVRMVKFADYTLYSNVQDNINSLRKKSKLDNKDTLKPE